MGIVSLIGDAAPTNGGSGLDAHIGLAFADGTMHGGHLFEAHASPTLEMFLVA
jgi:predicted DNA-binding protein with PD1-like motif